MVAYDYDHGSLGGDCLHFGCVPPKTLVRTAGICSLARRAAEFGLPFVDDHAVSADDDRLTARRGIVATDSSPSVPRLEGLVHVPYWTNETVFSRTAVPGHLVVLGGGPVGMEMGHVKLSTLAGSSFSEKLSSDRARRILRRLFGLKGRACTPEGAAR